MSALVRIAERLSHKLSGTIPLLGADYVYDPSVYAKCPHDNYLQRFAKGQKRVLLLGMNPGPWGMAQIGVPFGSVPHARDWLKVEGKIGVPERFHPSRPVLGWECHRVEPSGRRLWSLLESIYGAPCNMAKELVVLNYCPLLFLKANGQSCRNLPLNNLRGAKKLLQACDESLGEMLDVVKPEVAIGIGMFAEKRLRLVAGKKIKVGRMLHPSPASPMANQGFDRLARVALASHGVG